MKTLNEPELASSLPFHKSGVNWLDFSPGEKFLVTATDDGHLFVNTLEDYSMLKLIGHQDSVTSVSSTDSIVVSVSKDCTARLWKLVQDDQINWSESSVYRCHKSSINCVDIDHRFKQFCTASDDETVKIWSLMAANKLVMTLSCGHTNWVRHARFSNLNSNYLSSCGDDGFICIWDTRSKMVVSKMTTKPRTHFLSVQWHPTCSFLFSSSSSDSMIRIWDLRNNSKPVQRHQTHKSLVTSTHFHPNGKFLISSSRDQLIKIIDIVEAETVFSLKAHSAQVNCVRFSSDGEYFASAGSDRTVLLWKSNFADQTSGSLTDEEQISVNDDFDDNYEKELPRREINPGVDVETSQLSENLLRLRNNQMQRADPIDQDHPPDHHSQLTNLIDVVRSVMKQMKTISQSIANLDQRLLAIEQKPEYGLLSCSE